jgi:hypothetical protein
VPLRSVLLIVIIVIAAVGVAVASCNQNDASSSQLSRDSGVDTGVLDTGPSLDLDALFAEALPCPPDSGADEPPDTNDDIYGFDGCRPLPVRYVILGDSIPFCYFIDLAECGPHIIGVELQSTVVPGLVVEWFAFPGTVTADLPAQARKVQPGPGHILVFVWAIGNDLLTRTEDYPAWEAAWSQVFAYFTDVANFPDGATFLLNTQYSPYDECGDPPGPKTGVPLADEIWLQEVNRRLFLDVADQRNDTVAVDHYPDWLGHGDNANILGCPHCRADNTSWMLDVFHPNAIGHRHIADKWRVVLERMYASSCPSG